MVSSSAAGAGRPANGPSHSVGAHATAAGTAHGPQSHPPSSYASAAAANDRSTLLERLDYYYRIVSAIILSKQHPCTGTSTMAGWVSL